MSKAGLNNQPNSIHDWWTGHEDEKYWLEVTDRLDLGVNLKAPQANESGKPFWGYSLLRNLQKGDVVFHYKKDEQSIVALSRAAGKLWDDKVTWAARGLTARRAGIAPHLRPGLYAGLDAFETLEEKLTLGQIQSRQDDIATYKEELSTEVGDPLYFPFEMGDKRKMRPMQGYLFKLPSFFVSMFPQLSNAVLSNEYSQLAFRVMEESNFGTDYRAADEETSVAERDPFSVDPELVERGLYGHAKTQNDLAELVRYIGCTPLSPALGEPLYDLAWQRQNFLYIAEIKSLTLMNEEKQLRLGLGQILRYGNLLSKHGPLKLVLAVEYEPTDPSWITLCNSLGVIFVWPGNWTSLL